MFLYIPNSTAEVFSKTNPRHFSIRLRAHPSADPGRETETLERLANELRRNIAFEGAADTAQWPRSPPPRQRNNQWGRAERKPVLAFSCP